MDEKINVMIINHGNFGLELIKSAEMIVGKIENIKAFSLLPNMSIEDLIFQTEEYLKKVNEKTIILTDIFGGTPNNVAMYLKQKYKCFVLSGVNLAMLIELVLQRENNTNIKQIVEKIYTSAKDSINILEINKKEEIK